RAMAGLAMLLQNRRNIFGEGRRCRVVILAQHVPGETQNSGRESEWTFHRFLDLTISPRAFWKIPVNNRLFKRQIAATQAGACKELLPISPFASVPSYRNRRITRLWRSERY